MNNAIRFARVLALGALPALALAAGDYPPPVQRLVEQGVEIAEKFRAPGGLTGYGARADGRPLVLYATADGRHVIVGAMLDAAGRNVSEQHMRDHAPPPDLESAWTQLERSAWIAEGPAKPKRILYVFDDPNCPYCNALWRAWPSLDKGLQVRHVMVALLGPTSPSKAAAILGADDPVAAFVRHERDYDKGGIAPVAKIDPRVRARIDANNALMQALGVRATPAIFYRDTGGRVRSVLGMPQSSTLEEGNFPVTAGNRRRPLGAAEMQFLPYVNYCRTESCLNSSTVLRSMVTPP